MNSLPARSPREELRADPTALRPPESLEPQAFCYYRRLDRVRRFVQINYMSPIPLVTAARVACLEPSYFSAFFHAKTGMRFRDWLAFYRVSRAAERLGRRNDSITRVAYEVGFQDLRTFERAFKRFTAQTPSEFKKAIRPC